MSYRAQLADEMAEREQRWFPAIRALTAEWLALMDEESKRSPEAAIAVADQARSLLNTKKNAEGQLAGLARGRILEKQRAAEARVKAFAAKTPALADAAAAHAALEALLVERTATWERDFLLDVSPRGPRALAWSLLIARRSVEAQRPDLEREPGYQDRDLSRLRDQLERDQKRFHAAVDLSLLLSWLQRGAKLPADQRLASVDALLGPAKSDAQVLGRLKALLLGTKVYALEERKKMFDETPAQLAARQDPLLDFGLALDAERRALRDRRDAYAGRILKLRPQWRRAVLAEAGRPVAPDANSTLRVTFGRVSGYSPRDAVLMLPQTTLAGAIAKHTGADPFDVPQRIRDAHAAGKPSRWHDKGLKDVPVDFLADCDTTGGNSGSPTIDGKGRLVGVNFDRVWENVANDFGYNPEVARNVNADVRYLLWLLEEVEGAPGLVRELLGN